MIDSDGMIDSSTFCKGYIKQFGGRYLDSNNISWKVVNGDVVGKRGVSSKGGFRYCWLEDVPKDETVHSYLHGVDADYNETF